MIRTCRRRVFLALEKGTCEGKVWSICCNSDCAAPVPAAENHARPKSITSWHASTHPALLSPTEIAMNPPIFFLLSLLGLFLSDLYFLFAPSTCRLITRANVVISRLQDGPYTSCRKKTLRSSPLRATRRQPVADHSTWRAALFSFFPRQSGGSNFAVILRFLESDTLR